MSGVLSNRKRILFASESTYGTDQIGADYGDATADIIYQQTRTSSVENVKEVVPRTRESASIDGSGALLFNDRSEVALEIPLTGKRGSGAGNEAPYYEALLKACNFSVAVVSGTSATYTLTTVQQAGMTVYEYNRNSEDANWRLRYAVGVRGNAVFNFEVNTEAYITFTGLGQYTAQPTAAAAFFDANGNAALEKDASTAVTARTSGTEEQARKSGLGCSQMTVSFNGTTIAVKSLSFDLGLQTDRKDDTSGTTTLKEARNVRPPGGAITGSFSLQDAGAEYDTLIAAMEGKTVGNLVITNTDGTDTITTTIRVQLGFPARAEEGAHMVHDWPFFSVGDLSDLAGDTEISIVFT